MTKLIVCDGKTLDVRHVGPVIFRLAADAVPIKAHGYHLIDDEEARALVCELKKAGAIWVELPLQ